MISEAELRDMLQQWVKEYGYGGMPKESSTNILQTIIDHKGFTPSSGGFRAIPMNTVGDLVEAAVVRMQNTPGFFKAAMALKAHYTACPNNLTEGDRIGRLHSIGIPMTSMQYREQVGIGHAVLMLELDPPRRMAA